MKYPMVDILRKQSELMGKFEDIEFENGLLHWRGTIPRLHLDSQAGQMKLRKLAWEITEEIGEALDSAWVGYEAGFYEEVADAFHYLMELFIAVDASPLYESLDGAFDNCFPNLMKRHSRDQEWLLVVAALARAMNHLKNRPHKRKTQLVVPSWVIFETKLHDVFCAFLCACKSDGITAEMLWNSYFAKAEVNENRIADFKHDEGSFGGYPDENAR